MNKKVLSIIASVLIVVLFIPSVPVRASLTINQFIIRTQETCNADTSTTLGNALDSTVFPDRDPAYNGNGYNFVEQMIDCFDEFNFVSLQAYDYYVVGAVWNSGSGISEWWSVYVYAFNSSDVQPFLLSENYNGSHYSVPLFGTYGTNVGVYYECRFTSTEHLSWTTETSFSMVDTGALNLGSYGYTSSIGKYVLDTNIPVFSSHEANLLKPENTPLYQWVCTEGYSILTDIFSDTSGYDANGNIVNPGHGEIEANPHLGFRKFDSNVIYNRSNDSAYGLRVVYETDPIGFDILSNTPDDWELHYTTEINYVVGEYPDGNVLVPERQMVGSFTFEGTPWDVPLNHQQLSAKAGAFEVSPLDGIDHYITSSGTMGYYYAVISAMNGNYVKGNKARDKWGQFGGDIINAVGAFVSTALGGEINGLLESIDPSLSNGLLDFASQHLNVNYFYTMDSFQMTVYAYLTNGSTKSQTGSTTGDFSTLSTSSYTPGVIPEPTEENPEPTPNPPVEKTNENPVVPAGKDSNGNMTYVEVVINNNTSGGGGGSSNYPVINYNPSYAPSNDVVIDYGVDEMMETVDKYPEVTNKKFWDYFLIFKDNDFLEATTDWWNAMPDEITDILIASIGIISVFSIYRWIRRG